MTFGLLFPLAVLLTGTQHLHAWRGAGIHVTRPVMFWAGKWAQRDSATRRQTHHRVPGLDSPNLNWTLFSTRLVDASLQSHVSWKAQPTPLSVEQRGRTPECGAGRPLAAPRPGASLTVRLSGSPGCGQAALERVTFCRVRIPLARAGQRRRKASAPRCLQPPPLSRPVPFPWVSWVSCVQPASCHPPC